MRTTVVKQRQTGLDGVWRERNVAELRVVGLTEKVLGNVKCRIPYRQSPRPKGSTGREQFDKSWGRKVGATS